VCNFAVSSLTVTFLVSSTKAIEQIADAEKFDIVFQDAVTFSPRIDITDEVLKAFKGTSKNGCSDFSVGKGVRYRAGLAKENSDGKQRFVPAFAWAERTVDSRAC
jgi:hypothetical protein